MVSGLSVGGGALSTFSRKSYDPKKEEPTPQAWRCHVKAFWKMFLDDDVFLVQSSLYI